MPQEIMHLCTDSSFSVKLITDSATAIILLHSLLIASVRGNYPVWLLHFASTVLSMLCRRWYSIRVKLVLVSSWITIIRISELNSIKNASLRVAAPQNLFWAPISVLVPIMQTFNCRLCTVALLYQFFLQCFDTVVWVISPVKNPSPIWLTKCLVGH